MSFLTTGATTVTLAHIYRVGPCSAGRIIKQVCRALVWKLKKKYIQVPSTDAEWMEVVNGFDQRWHYPGCVGALDGKHIRMRKPAKSGSYFYNYKGYFSIILMALVNYNYEFIFTDIGAEGAASDGGVWRNCQLHQDLASGDVKLPPDVLLKGTNKTVCCHIVGDDAFPLSTNLMKPYAKRELTDREAVFNYRCSRARRLVENVFGIAAARFRVLHTEISFNPLVTSRIVLAIATLHNIMRKVSGAAYIPPGMCDGQGNSFCVQPGTWRIQDGNTLQMTGLRGAHARNATNDAKNMRDAIADYFVTDLGKVSWQNDFIHNTHANFLRNISTVPH